MAAAGVVPDRQLPAALEAAEPPEARGVARDDVRLLVSDVARDAIEHARFRDLPRLLSRGDLLVVNTSGTLSAAVAAEADSGLACDVHFSTRLPGGFWTVELRRFDNASSQPCRDGRAGMRLRLPAGGSVTLLSPYPMHAARGFPSRLWLSAVALPEPVPQYLAQHGWPIRYSYVPEPWPAPMYQTVFATEPGSAEMPSAGRPFTPALVGRLVAEGIRFAPLLLHTGVASLEAHEPPYEEIYRVSRETADRVNATRRAGGRVIAVGTTAVRALETVTDAHGTVHPGKGWTDLVITADRPLRAVDSLITGFHEPRATHLAILERVIERGAPACPCGLGVPGSRSGAGHLQRAYLAAREAGYLWHEFGDSHLILGSRGANGRVAPRLGESAHGHATFLQGLREAGLPAEVPRPDRGRTPPAPSLDNECRVPYRSSA